MWVCVGWVWGKTFQLREITRVQPFHFYSSKPTSCVVDTQKWNQLKNWNLFSSNSRFDSVKWTVKKSRIRMQLMYCKNCKQRISLVSHQSHSLTQLSSTFYGQQFHQSAENAFVSNGIHRFLVSVNFWFTLTTLKRRSCSTRDYCKRLKLYSHSTRSNIRHCQHHCINEACY